jgi:hypothetical protein
MTHSCRAPPHLPPVAPPLPSSSIRLRHSIEQVKATIPQAVKASTHRGEARAASDGVKDAGSVSSLAILFGAAAHLVWLGLAWLSLLFLPSLDCVIVLEHGAKDYGSQVSVCTAVERDGGEPNARVQPRPPRCHSALRSLLRGGGGGPPRCGEWVYR